MELHLSWYTFITLSTFLGLIGKSFQVSNYDSRFVLGEIPSLKNSFLICLFTENGLRERKNYNDTLNSPEASFKSALYRFAKKVWGQNSPRE